MPSTSDITRRAEQALALLDAQQAERHDGATDWLREATYIASIYVPPDIGRPSCVLTDIPRVTKLLQLVARGNYIETAGLAAGFPKQTIHYWRKQAEAGQVAAIAFCDALERAQAEAETEAVDHIRSTRKRPELWAASMTHLERRHPDRWGKRQDDASTPRVVVQIGARDSDVSVSVGSIITTPDTPIESTQGVPTTYVESAQVTERRLSDVATGRIKVTADERGTSDPPGQRRRNRVGLQPGTRRSPSPRRADRVKGDA